MESLKELGGEKGLVSCEDFTAQKLWFEASEASKDRDHSHVFDRVKMVKEVLFKIFKV